MPRLQRGRLHLLDLVGNGRSCRLLVAMRPAVMNFVSVVIDEARDGAVWSDGPTGPDVENSHGIEIQRIGVLPVAAGLLRGKLPGFAFVAGIRGDAGRARVILIITANSNDFPFIPARDGESSRGGVAVDDGCFRDGPGASRVRGVKDTGGRASGAKKDFLAGE